MAGIRHLACPDDTQSSCNARKASDGRQPPCSLKERTARAEGSPTQPPLQHPWRSRLYPRLRLHPWRQRVDDFPHEPPRPHPTTLGHSHCHRFHVRRRRHQPLLKAPAFLQGRQVPHLREVQLQEHTGKLLRTGIFHQPQLLAERLDQFIHLQRRANQPLVSVPAGEKQLLRRPAD